MKLKNLLSSIVENKKNGQLNVSLKKNKLKEFGISKEELFNMDIQPRLNKLMFDD